jgi:uncharacterized protein
MMAHSQFQFSGASMDAATQLAFRQSSEPTLDQVDPRGPRGRAVQVVSGMANQPALNQACVTEIVRLHDVPFSGTIDPKMGTAGILSETLFGRTRGAVLAILYGHVGESFYLRQLARKTGIMLGPVQREIRQLVDSGLVTKKIVGAQTLYSANRNSPVFAEIKNLVTKTVGMHDVLCAALEPLLDRINLAFVYGSVARSGETEQSDVDVMIVGKVKFEEIVSKLTDAQKTLNREINPTVYSIKEFTSKLRANFLKHVLAEKKLFIVGDEHVLRELGQK